MHKLAVWVPYLVLCGCSSRGHLPRVVVGPPDSSSSAPEVTAIRDLGAPRLVPDHPIPGGGSDGTAVVGELVLVTGDDFGRRPKVTVSGMVAEQIARTEDGGIVIRVPWGVRTGPQPFTVSTPGGKNSATFPVRRHALATVPSRDQIHVLDVSRETLRRAGAPLHLPSAHRVSYCGGGQTAYVGGRTASGLLQIAVLDMAAPGGPSIEGTQSLPGDRLVALTAAARTPIAVAMSDTFLMVLDTRDPMRPARYRPRRLPDALAGKIVTAELSPDGTLLAALLRRSNEVLLYELRGEDAQLALLARSQVFPRARTRAPLLRDLRFSADSSTLWILSGDTHRSLWHGRFPLRLTALKITLERRGTTRRFGVLSIWRSLDVPHRAAPVALAVARGQPTARGTTVSVPPTKAAVFITAHDSKLLRLAKTRLDRRRGLRRAVRLLKGASPLGTVVKTDIDGRGGPMLTSPALLGAVEITSDSQVLLVAGARPAGKPSKLRLVYGVTAYRVFGKREPQVIELAEVDPDTLKRPFLLGEIRVQP